jgi:hypothetical protein
MTATNHSLFHQNIIALYGKEGERWLADLPRIIRLLENAWQLSHLEVLDKADD